MKLSRSCWIFLSALLLIGAGCGGDDENVIGGPADGEDQVVLTLRNFGDPSPGHFALWAEENGVKTRVASFGVLDGAPVTLDGDPLTSFEQEDRLAGADRLLITVETDTAATTPAGAAFLAGTPGDLQAELTVAAGVGADLTGAAGFFLFDTPSTEDDADAGRGVWWTDGEGAAGLLLPTLSAGWVYEGWVTHRVTGKAYTTGRFTNPGAADSDGAGATGGGGDGYPFPGQDFVTAAGDVPVLDVDGGVYGVSITLEPATDPSDEPFFLTLLQKDAGSGNLVLSVQRFIGSPAESYYEIWADFPDSTVSLGRFVYSLSAIRDVTTGDVITGFPVGSNVLSADDFLISIERNDGDPSPSGSYFLGAAANGDTLQMSYDHPLALGDVFAGTGTYTLDTPTSPESDADYYRGIWFYDTTGTDTVSSLDLPAAPSGWIYQGWIVRLRTGTTSDTLISIGTFADPNGADSDGAGAYAGAGAAPLFPGQDFLVGSNRRFNQSSYAVKISLEPANDSTPASPFLVLFEDLLVTPQNPGVQQSMTNKSASLPAAKGILDAFNSLQMASNGNRLPRATIHFGSK
ncbi:MAG: hypothetical protein JW958_05560 [Candidatus Eisenbacteria bacterium]|nr:hypothetical protein [Candidatus Eisenbacteria bacterium]